MNIVPYQHILSIAGMILFYTLTEVSETIKDTPMNKLIGVSLKK